MGPSQREVPRYLWPSSMTLRHRITTWFIYGFCARFRRGPFYILGRNYHFRHHRCTCPVDAHDECCRICATNPFDSS